MKVNVHDPRGEELAQVLTRATAALAQVPSPRVDAELLAAHLLYDGSRSRLQHAALMGERLTPDQVAEYEALVARRAYRDAATHHRLRSLLPPRTGSRTGRVRTPPRDRTTRRRSPQSAGRTHRISNRSAAHRRPVHRIRAIAAAIKSELPNARCLRWNSPKTPSPTPARTWSRSACTWFRGTPSPPCPNLPEPSTRCSRTLRTFRRRTYPPTRKPPCTTRTWHYTAGERTACRCPPQLPPAPRASYPRRPVHHGARRHPGRRRRRAAGAHRLRGLLPGA